MSGIRGVMNRMAALRFIFGVYTKWGTEGESLPEKVHQWMIKEGNLESIEPQIRYMLGSNVDNREWLVRVSMGLAVFKVLDELTRQ